jgi:hypothetical protein
VIIEAGTLSDLEECLASEFMTMFAGRTFKNSIGNDVELKSFIHSLPVKTGDDESKTDADYPEPYIVSEVTGGKQASENDPHVVSVAAVICVCDDNTARHGHQDVLAIIHKIIERFGKNPLLAGRFNLRYPIEWSLSDEDTYPYYYGGLLMQFEVAAIEKEDELA